MPTLPSKQMFTVLRYVAILAVVPYAYRLVTYVAGSVLQGLTAWQAIMATSNFNID